jgi:hypothetical protein
VLIATSVVGVIFGLILIGGLLWLATICAMKGKWVFFVLGWFSGIFWLVGAARLAKPWSRWARTRYGAQAMEAAGRRFPRRRFSRRTNNNINNDV